MKHGLNLPFKVSQLKAITQMLTLLDCFHTMNRCFILSILLQYLMEFFYRLILTHNNLPLKQERFSNHYSRLLNAYSLESWSNWKHVQLRCNLYDGMWLESWTKITSLRLNLVSTLPWFIYWQWCKRMMFNYCQVVFKQEYNSRHKFKI